MNICRFRQFAIAVVIIGSLAACTNGNSADAGSTEPMAASAEPATSRPPQASPPLEAPATAEQQTTGTESFRGWYMEHGGQASFQTCGQSQPLKVAGAAELSAKARAFGLEQDTPVYVRVSGSIRGDELRVSNVEQFGSPTPVRDCGLTGVVLPEPSASKD